MESNAQVVRRAFDEFLKGNIPAVTNVCTDDVTWGSYENPAVPFAGMFKGKEGVQRFFSQLSEEVDYKDFTPRDFYSQGDTVIAIGRHAGRVKKTGITFDHDWAMIFKLRDSKVYSYFCFVDTRDQADAFRQGLGIERKETIPAAGSGVER